MGEVVCNSVNKNEVLCCATKVHRDKTSLYVAKLSSQSDSMCIIFSCFVYGQNSGPDTEPLQPRSVDSWCGVELTKITYKIVCGAYVAAKRRLRSDDL